MRKKKPSKFEKAVQWIADEDEPNELDPEVIKDSISVQLISCVFEKEEDEIARLIVKKRNQDLAKSRK